MEPCGEEFCCEIPARGFVKNQYQKGRGDGMSDSESGNISDLDIDEMAATVQSPDMQTLEDRISERPHFVTQQHNFNSTESVNSKIARHLFSSNSLPRRQNLVQVGLQP